MRRRKFKKAASVVTVGTLAAALALGSVNADTITAEAAESSSSDGAVLSAFEDPDSDAKPMVRWWFPDAGAGEDEDDTSIEEYINALADAGYGGVEITMLSTGTDMDYEDVAEYGWGSENYVNLLKKALKAANEIEGGFTVDITITAHWPTVINDVDPNDSAAAQELIYTTQEADVSEDTSITLTLPETKLYDSPNAITAGAFIFTDTLVDTYLIKSDGNGGYDYDTAINVTDYIEESYGYAAGVPDEEAFEEWYSDYYDDLEEAYETYVLEIFGEEPAEDADLTVSYNGKQDADGNRARMQDTQYYYTLDTTKLSEDVQEDLENGEYTLVNTYTRGTGQVMSDAIISGCSDMMVNRTYTTNYFSEEGTDALIWYWENKILDSELRALLEENGSSIFEDSIEASTNSGGSFWSSEVVSRFEQDYGTEIGENLSLIVALSNSLTSDEIDISDAQTSFQITLGNLYEEVHSEEISDWASTFGYSYRAQCYAITGQDICSSELATDIPEGDNASKGDGLRTMASVVNVDEKESLSMEAVTAMSIGKLNWADVVTEVAQNYSDGVNHVVLHGSGYTKSVTGYGSYWPGWRAFGGMNGDSYSPWRCDFDDIDNLNGYMARTQAVLQEGTAKIDVLFLKDSSSGSNLGSGNSFQTLLNEGYSYNMSTEAIFESENATVSNNVLAEDGPAYKVLVLNSVSQISAEGMETVVEYAKAGLPIVLYNCSVSDVYGLETETNTVEALLAAYAELQTLDNVKTASSESELLAVFEELGVTSDASTSDGTEYLEITHYEDDTNGSDYYYMFNNPSAMTNNSGFVSDGQNASYKSGDSITSVVTLTGEGVPYELDAWTGEITPIAGYTVNDDGTVSVEVTLDGGDSTIIALLNEKTASTYVESADEGIEYNSDGNIVYKSNETGTVELTLSDGTTSEVTVDSELETLDLSDASWSLTIDSYVPADDLDSEENIDYISSQGYTVYVDPTLTDIKTATLEIDALSIWADIEATDDELEALGVDAMADISGIGYYTTTFDLPEGWDETTGAVLEIGYNYDMLISVTVNGNEISAINNVSDKVDIGEYLQVGENTITIKMSTVMFNAMQAASTGKHSTSGFGSNDFTTRVDCGIDSVTLTPYTTVTVLEVSDDTDDGTGGTDTDEGNSGYAGDGDSDTGSGTIEDTDDTDDGTDDTDDGTDDTDDADGADDTDDSTGSTDDDSDSGSSSGSSSSTDSTSATKTGDSSPIAVSIVILCLAAAAVVFALYRRKKSANI